MGKIYDPGVTDITKQGIKAMQQALHLLHPQIISPLSSDQTLTTARNMNIAQGIQQDLTKLYPQIVNGFKQAIPQDAKAISGAIGQLIQTNPSQYPQSQAQIQVPTGTPEPTPTPFGKQVLDGYVMRTPRQYTPLIDAAAKKHKIPTSYLSGALANESMGFNPDVISGKIASPAGAQGIAQFMPTTAKGMGINPFDPSQAIDGMAKLLRAHYDQFGQRPDLALAAYNAGAGAVQQYGGVPPFTETQNYVKNIMKDSQTTYGGN